MQILRVSATDDDDVHPLRAILNTRAERVVAAVFEERWRAAIRSGLGSRVLRCEWINSLL